MSKQRGNRGHTEPILRGLYLADPDLFERLVNGPLHSRSLRSNGVTPSKGFNDVVNGIRGGTLGALSPVEEWAIKQIKNQPAAGAGLLQGDPIQPPSGMTVSVGLKSTGLDLDLEPDPKEEEVEGGTHRLFPELKSIGDAYLRELQRDFGMDPLKALNPSTGILGFVCLTRHDRVLQFTNVQILADKKKGLPAINVGWEVNGVEISQRKNGEICFSREAFTLLDGRIGGIWSRSHELVMTLKGWGYKGQSGLEKKGSHWFQLIPKNGSWSFMPISEEEYHRLNAENRASINGAH